MSQKDHPKPQALKQGKDFNKAGPKSKSGGYNRRSSQKAELREAMNSKGNIFDRRHAELRQQAAEARKAAEQARQLAQWTFRCDQAENARALLDLTANTLAEKVALLVLEKFPDATPNKEEGISRTEAAKLEMLDHLNGDELEREAAIKVGVSAASRALFRAYEEMTNPATPVADDTAGNEVSIEAEDIVVEAETRETVTA